MSVNAWKTETSQMALNAAITLHEELQDDDAFNGYEGTKEDFDRLYDECLAITRYELGKEADVFKVVETFYAYQLEIESGERELGWYL